MVLVQSSFHTSWASLYEMVQDPNSLDWNGNELEHELEDMRHTSIIEAQWSWQDVILICLMSFFTSKKAWNFFVKSLADKIWSEKNEEIKVSPLMPIRVKKDSDDFWHRKLILKVKLLHFLTSLDYTNSQNLIIFFGDVDV